jgi:hypothetical protein
MRRRITFFFITGNASILAMAASMFFSTGHVRENDDVSLRFALIGFALDHGVNRDGLGQPECA